MAEFKKAYAKTMTFQPDKKLRFDNGNTSYAGIQLAKTPGWEGWKYTERGDKVPEEVVENYFYLDIWLPLWCHQIDCQEVAWAIFDYAVTSCNLEAIRLAQTISTDTVTGVMSPASIDLLNCSDEFEFCDRYALARIRKYLYEELSYDELVNRVKRSLAGALVD